MILEVRIQIHPRLVEGPPFLSQSLEPRLPVGFRSFSFPFQISHFLLDAPEFLVVLHAIRHFHVLVDPFLVIIENAHVIVVTVQVGAFGIQKVIERLNGS